MLISGFLYALRPLTENYIEIQHLCTYVDKAGVDVLFVLLRRPQEHSSTIH